eukprot:s252_g4.t1
MRSWLPFVSLDFAIADALPFCAAMTSSFFSAGLFGRHVRDAARMAGLLTTSTAIVLASSWIRSPVASASAVSPFAARLLQVSACFCFPYNSGQRSLQGYFRSAWSWNLVSSVQEGTHCLLDVALADALPCSCAVRFSHLTAESRASKTLRDASCMASRVVTHVWGWIHPPLASAYVIPPFVPRAACDKCKRQGLEGFIRLHHSKQLVPVVLRHAHECGSEFRKLHEISGAVHGAVVAISRSLHPVQAAPQKDAVPRSSGCSTLPPPMMGTPQPPSPSPSAACLLRLQGALRSVFRPDIEAAVEANCLEVSPVEETLRLAQVPFILMIRNLLPLLPSQALQDREVLLNLVMVGHSHGGVIAHSLAQRLEAVGLLVKGIVAVDTLALPRMTETPLPRFDPQALFRHLSPYHWQLTSSKVNMMAPEDVDHSRILHQSSWDLAAVVSRMCRRHSGQPSDSDRRIRPQAPPSDHAADNRRRGEERIGRGRSLRPQSPQKAPQAHGRAPERRPQGLPPFYWVPTVDRISEFEVSGSCGELVTKTGHYQEAGALQIAGTMRMAAGGLYLWTLQIVQQCAERPEVHFGLQGTDHARPWRFVSALRCTRSRDDGPWLSRPGGDLPIAVGDFIHCEAVSPPGTDMEDIRPVYNSSAQRLRFVRPLGENVPVFLADEAFGWPSCWAESSLVLAENAVHAMAGLGKPSWLPEDPRTDGSAFIGPKFPSCGGDPFVLQNRLRRESNRAGSNAEELVI